MQTAGIIITLLGIIATWLVGFYYITRIAVEIPIEVKSGKLPIYNGLKYVLPLGASVNLVVLITVKYIPGYVFSDLASDIVIFCLFLGAFNWLTTPVANRRNPTPNYYGFGMRRTALWYILGAMTLTLAQPVHLIHYYLFHVVQF